MLINKSIFSGFTTPILFTFLLATVGCGGGDNTQSVDDVIGQTPTVEPIAAVVKAAVPLGYAASISMAEVNGIDFPNAVSSNTCTSYPCLATIVITIEPDSLPIAIDGIADNGEIIVVGLWSSAVQAIMTVIFSDLNAGNDFLSIQKISTIPVSQQGNFLTIVYANTDINVETDSDNSIVLNDEQIQAEYQRLSQTIPEDPEVSVDMGAWVIEVDNFNTETILSDDKYQILGGGQYFDIAAGDVSVLQLGINALDFSAACSLNPTGGFAVLQEVQVTTGERAGWPKLGQAFIQFEPECDGRARVLLGTGSFFLISGDRIDLEF